jgi:hypothetical protein
MFEKNYPYQWVMNAIMMVTGSIKNIPTTAKKEAQN